MTDTCKRYAELRYDGGRKLSGVAIRYGDTAEISEYYHERIAPGAFGDVARADVILDTMHMRDRPLARTGKGGLTLYDGPNELRFTAELPNTRDADDTLELVKSGVLRGSSVEFRPRGVDQKDGPLHEVTKATLIRIGVVDKPAYPQSTVAARYAPDGSEHEGDMTRDEIKKMVADTLEAEQAKKDFDPAKFAQRMATEITKSTKAEIKAALDERDKAETEKRAAEEAAKKAAGDAEQRAEDRAELLVMTRGLLPKDFETRGATEQEILVAAVGDEVKDAAKRSEDYLMAKLEGIVERRAEAANGQNRKAPAGLKTHQQRGGEVATAFTRPLSITQMRARKGA